jgi:poly(3-hydroxybutyrate) depolymerase
VISSGEIPLIGDSVRGDTGSPTSLAAGSHTISLSHEGRERPYLLHLPPATGAEGVSLVLELHGRGIDPLSFDRWTRFRHSADQAGFVVALPSAVGEIWNDGRFPRLARDGPDDIGYLVALIEDACTRFLIDMRRIYVVGMSNGATMAVWIPRRVEARTCRLPLRPVLAEVSTSLLLGT